MDLWELQQAAFVLCGFEPPELAELLPSPPNPYGLSASTPLNWADVLSGTIDPRRYGLEGPVKELRALIHSLRLAALSQALPTTHGIEAGCVVEWVEPGAVARWASEKGYSIPLELAALIEDISVEEQTPDPVARPGKPAVAKSAIQEGKTRNGI